MKQILDRFKNELHGFRERSHQKQFVDAVMAAAALVALADRDHRLSELVTRDRVLSRLGELKPVSVRDAVETYDRHARALIDDPDRSRQEIFKLLGEFSGDSEEVTTLVRACLAIGHADTDFSPRERSVVEQICGAIGVDPGELGVYDI
jgi:tellurite resistance protein TerB